MSLAVDSLVQHDCLHVVQRAYVIGVEILRRIGEVAVIARQLPVRVALLQSVGRRGLVAEVPHLVEQVFHAPPGQEDVAVVQQLRHAVLLVTLGVVGVDHLQRLAHLVAVQDLFQIVLHVVLQGGVALVLARGLDIAQSLRRVHVVARDLVARVASQTIPDRHLLVIIKVVVQRGHFVGVTQPGHLGRQVVNRHAVVEQQGKLGGVAVDVALDIAAQPAVVVVAALHHDDVAKVLAQEDAFLRKLSLPSRGQAGVGGKCQRRRGEQPHQEQDRQSQGNATGKMLLDFHNKTPFLHFLDQTP